MILRSALSAAAAAAVLAACGGAALQRANPSLSLAPTFRYSGPMPPMQARHATPRSWMSLAAKRIKKLLYVAGAVTSTVYVYDYKTGTPVGELTGFSQPEGECVDKKGDVWITNWAGATVSEYAHGGTSPLATLYTNSYQAGCSIDPKSGDLAVSTFYGTLDVWKNARGTPTNYASSGCPYFWGPGYDNHGNLFVESQNKGTGPYVCELPYRGSALGVVSFNQTINYGADVMWDGKFITFGDQDFSSGTSGVYQATQNASGGLALAGKTKLADPCGFNNDVIQPFILGSANTPENMQQGTIVIGSNNGCFNVVDLWSYPAGGTPTRVINPPDKVLFGAVVSIRETPRP